MKINPSMAGIIDPKYYYPDTLVTNQTRDRGNSNSNIIKNSYRYNSVFNLGVMSSVYFTEFRIIEDQDYPISAWEESQGKLIRGVTSRASAKIEEYIKNRLTVSNINGQFLEGEELVVVENAEDDSDIIPNSYLQRENGFYVLQETDFKIILDTGLVISTKGRTNEVW